MRLKTLALILFLYIFFIQIASALEVSDGKLKLILHEDIGRFSLYYLSDAEAGTYTSLFTDQDPRTTSLSIVINNKVYRLGDSFSFKESASQTANGARFTWKSNQLEVVQEFSFIRSLTALESDGLKITLTFTNISDEDLEIGTRFILDTNLGEDQSSHFKTDRITKLTAEKKLDSSNMAEYWVSPKDDELGLMMLTGDSHVTTPDVIIFANWKRLNDTSWSYSTSGSRNFNLAPYSINDSAVCQYYFPQTVLSGLNTQIVMVMGKYTESGFFTKSVKNNSNTSTSNSTDTTTSDNSSTQETGSSTTTTTNDSGILPAESNKTTSPESLFNISIKGDISTLETVLEEINKKIADESYSNKDIELLEKIITELENKAESYNQNQ